MQNNINHYPQPEQTQFLSSANSNTQFSPMPASSIDPAQSPFPPSQPFWPVNPVSNEGGNISSLAGPPARGWVAQMPPLGVPSSFNPPKPLQKRSTRRFLVMGGAIGIVILLVIVVSIFWLMTKTGTNVTLYQVEQQSVTQYVGGGGIIYPEQQFNVSYPLPERVVSVSVKAGDKVTVNQPLIQLDPSQLNAQITQAANNMAAAQSYLDSVSTNGNPVTIAQAQQAYNQAKDRYNALVAEYSSPLVHDGALISPMNGIVTSVAINPGEIFNGDTTLLTIMDESTVIVHMEVPLSYLGIVRVGQSAVVTPSALPNLSFNGTVSSIIPEADPQTDTFEVWVNVPNPKNSLLPGMSAFVRIQQKLKAIVVPRLAVLNPDRESIVFVVHHQHVYLQHVTVIGRSIDDIFVMAGLTANDLVVLVGAYSLQNGQAVKVMNIDKPTH